MKHPTPGQPLEIPASDYNAFVEAALRTRERSGTPVIIPARGSDRNLLLVQNNSGSNRSQYDALGIDSIITAPTTDASEFKGNWGFVCGTPATGDQLVILAHPIPDGEYGRAYAAGHCPVQISVSDAAHGYAVVSDGNIHLDSADAGPFAILWKEAGTGTKWAVVRFDEHTAASGQWLDPIRYYGSIGANDSLTLGKLNPVAAGIPGLLHIPAGTITQVRAGVSGEMTAGTITIKCRTSDDWPADGDVDAWDDDSGADTVVLDSTHHSRIETDWTYAVSLGDVLGGVAAVSADYAGSCAEIWVWPYFVPG